MVIDEQVIFVCRKIVILLSLDVQCCIPIRFFLSESEENDLVLTYDVSAERSSCRMRR